MNVYLAQINNTYGRNAFLPYSVGLLQAYAQTIPAIRENYCFKDLFYLRKDVEQVVKSMDNPAVFGVSCYIWNWEYSLALARTVKAHYPDCLIVLGGPHCPVLSDDFFTEHSFANIIVHYEGEVAFGEVLLEKLKDKPDYTQVAGLSVNVDGKSVKTLMRQRMADLSVIPSPYLTGVFDEIIKRDHDFHGSQETHRGCPYGCTFCDWGSNVFAKVKQFDAERLIAEIEWFADHKIDLLYNCDANYGMFARDIDLTKQMAAIKDRTGFPKKFRAAYAKNSNETVFTIAKILHEAGMNKGVTLSFQSLNEKTLDLIKRKNIKMDNFRELNKRYRSEGIATYSEFIIGLPGETYDTFADGLNIAVASGQHDSLQVYTCEALPNSEMSHPDYKKLHGIKTVRTPVLFFHGTPIVDPHQEFYHLIVETATLPPEDWLKCEMFAWAIQAFHCLSLTQVIALYAYKKHKVSYREFYERLLKYGQENSKSIIGEAYQLAEKTFLNLRSGTDWSFIDQRFGNIIWPPEEAGFLTTVVHKDYFYQEIHHWAEGFLNAPELADIIMYQKEMIKSPGQESAKFVLQYNVPEFIKDAYFDEEKELVVSPREYTVVVDMPNLTVEDYAREVVWYGRKGGKFINAIV